MFVPVLAHDQHPLMPTTPARARRWIKSGKATAFWKGGLFCVRLNVEPLRREVQPIAVGIDPGSKREGYSVTSATHTYLNIQAEARDGVLEQEARQLAKETGFIERERAFNGADFAQALILGWLQQPDERLSGFTQILERREVSITASGLSQRFTEEAATFMQRLLERLAEVQRPRRGR